MNKKAKRGRPSRPESSLLRLPSTLNIALHNEAPTDSRNNMQSSLPSSQSPGIFRPRKFLFLEWESRLRIGKYRRQQGSAELQRERRVHDYPSACTPGHGDAIETERRSGEQQNE